VTTGTTSPGKAKRGPKPKPAAVKRSEWIRLRVSPVEKATIEARAEEAGEEVSERLRRIGMEPVKGKPTLRAETPAAQARGDFEARVQAMARYMPRQNAETVVRRELAKEGGR
jgi:hypothetical protein